MDYHKQLIYSLILATIVFISIVLSKKAVRHFSFVKAIEINRRKVVYYLIYFLIYLFAISILAIIWGFEFKQIILTLSSILAVLGVGFFAQWSILSNLTSSAILFFSHPVRIGNRIRIIDKDYDYTGLVTDISGFFLFMRTDEGKNVTIPTSIIMQKGIEILGNEDSKQEDDKQTDETHQLDENKN